MSHNNRQHRQFALTYDQRLLLDMYINFYNHTNRQMDALYDLQSEIRENINQIIGLSGRQHNRTFNESYNSNTNFTNFTNFASNRQQPNHNSRRGGQNRTQPQQHIPASSNSRVVYIEGIPYLLDLTNFMRLGNPANNAAAGNIWRSFYDNIAVAPTRVQIENATRVLQFSEIENPINNSCPITLERFEQNSTVSQILHCGHIFTPSGIESWLHSNVRCPVCRYDIREYRAPPLPAASSTREERHQTTEPGNDEEYNNENDNENNRDNSEEESKEDPILPSENNDNERISNSRTRRNPIITNETITNVLSNITEEILNGILPPNNGTRSVFDPSQNSLFYDSSNNQFIFEGFIRR